MSKKNNSINKKKYKIKNNPEDLIFLKKTNHQENFFDVNLNLENTQENNESTQVNENTLENNENTPEKNENTPENTPKNENTLENN